MLTAQRDRVDRGSGKQRNGMAFGLGACHSANERPQHKAMWTRKHVRAVTRARVCGRVCWHLSANDQQSNSKEGNNREKSGLSLVTYLGHGRGRTRTSQWAGARSVLVLVLSGGQRVIVVVHRLAHER